VKALTLLFYLIFSQTLKAEIVSPVCDEVHSSVTWNYCFSPGVGKNAQKLILHFHGGGLSEKSWFDPNDYAEQIRHYWKVNGIDAPSVVSVSFGQMWLLSKQSSLPQSGLYEVFKNEVFPFIEKTLMNDKVNDRLIIGESMGGFNAGTFAMQNIKLFSKIALICPALGFESDEVIKNLEDYINQTGAQPPYAKYLYKIRDQYFTSPKQEYDVSPLTLIKALNFSTYWPTFFLSCGDKDQYGFFYGANAFVKLAIAHGFETIWKPIANGVHCSVDVDALAKFLVD
jgi:hypothetical protein